MHVHICSCAREILGTNLETARRTGQHVEPRTGIKREAYTPYSTNESINKWSQFLHPDITWLIRLRGDDLLGAGGACRRGRRFHRHRSRDPRRAVGSGSGRGRLPSRTNARPSLAPLSRKISRSVLLPLASYVPRSLSCGNPMHMHARPTTPARFSHRGFPFFFPAGRGWCCPVVHAGSSLLGKREDLSDAVLWWKKEVYAWSNLFGLCLSTFSL